MAFVVPLLLGLFPRLRLPSVVLEIVAGIVLGPSVLGWVRVDLPLQVLSLLGLAFLLFLAGLEIDLHRLRGRLLGLVSAGFAASFALGLAVSGGLVLVAVLVGLGLARAGRWRRLSADLGRLQDSSAQIRVRGAVLLLALLVWVAQRLSLEVILGAFLAGALLRVVDRDELMTHPKFRVKLEALGYGFLVPVFFVVSGIRFNLQALTTNPANLRLLPLFLAVLLAVRGLPAWLYRSRVGTRHSVVAGLLQATSLPFIVAATQIGMELGRLDQATGAALVAAGLLSVLLFPLAAPYRARGSRRRSISV